MIKGNIFNVQRFSIHDGPGIRTTIFLKGCPLNCLWCHNPESQSYNQEIIHFHGKCSYCRLCASQCPNRAITIENRVLVIDKRLCILCGNCIKACPKRALEKAGAARTVMEIVKEIEKDIIFYDESGGGVTFSGGEPLSQPKYLYEVLKECKNKDIHTAVDTCGYGPWDNFNMILNEVDLFLYDIKIINRENHIEYTGVPNDTILENLKRLSINNKRIFIRIPIIPSINDDEKNLMEIGEFISRIKLDQVNILPYHNIGSDKYRRIGKDYELKEIEEPSEESMIKIKGIFEGFGLRVKIGG